MNPRKTLVLLVLLILTCLRAHVLGADKVDFEITADYFGKYIWRGQNLSDDPVFQPGISAGYKGLTGGIWGNMDTTNINGNSGDFSEIDYSLDYSAELPGLKGIGYSLGVIYYDFPGTMIPDTTEFYGGLNFDAPLSPSVTFYRDLDEAEGTYISLGLGHSIEKIAELWPGMPIGMNIGAGFGWGNSDYNKYYWGVDENKFNDLTMSVSFPVSIAGWDLAASLNYVTLLSSDIRKSDAYNRSSDAFFAGISIAKSF